MTKKNPQYLLYNNEFHSEHDTLFKNTNRSFRYGDGLFETMRYANSKIHLFDAHIERLLNGLQFLRIEIPKNWNKQFFKNKIISLLEKNNLYENARIRLSIFRSDGGYYAPRSNKGDFLIEVDSFTDPGFTLNKKGLKVDIFTEMEKACNLYSNYKSSNALVYVLASINRKEEQLDDCLLINSKNRVAEAISSNLFMVKNGEVITPPLTEGCVAGVMRSHILEIMEQQGIKYHLNPVLLEDLFNADEMFLTDSIKGIRWVSSYKVKRYDLGIAKDLSEMLNQEI